MLHSPSFRVSLILGLCKWTTHHLGAGTWLFFFLLFEASPLAAQHATVRGLGWEKAQVPFGSEPAIVLLFGLTCIVFNSFQVMGRRALKGPRPLS